MQARRRQAETLSQDRGRGPVRTRRFLLVLGAMIVLGLGYAAVSALALPNYSAPPEVQGTARLGERLVCGSGSWSGNVTKFEYEWVRGGIIVSSGVTYPLTKADEGHEVWCIVKATNAEGTAEAESFNSVEFGKPPQEVAPESQVAPKASGEARVGASLSCSEGTWSGTTPITYSYNWLRDKEAIKSAISSSYTVQEGDAGHSLSCKVTAKNGAGEAFRESENSISIGATKPENTTRPEIVPTTPSVGETVTCKEGQWTGSAPLSFQYKWLRNGTTEIPSQISQTYVVQAADEGQTLTCKVTAKNPAGEARAESSPVTVNSGRIENVSLPAISPSKEIKIGTPLTCSNGQWTGSPIEFRYQWLRAGSPIEGQTSSKYTTQSLDRELSLACEVTAKHGTSEGTQRSQPVTVCNGSCAGAPKNTGLPSIEGGPPKLHQGLKCKQGSWSPSPTQFVYQWLRDGTTSIPQGTTNAYEVQEADEGHELSCRVTASNGEGSSSPAMSEGVRVGGSPPSDVTLPEITGSPRAGEALTCGHGEWHGVPAPTFTYRWLRDGSQVGAEQAYTVGPEDRGHTLACEVTAANGEEPSVKVASGGIHVEGSPPEANSEPVITGEAKVGEELRCSQGQWSGAPAPVFSYQWLLSGVEVSGATTETFTVGSSARGLVVTCRVTGSSTEGMKAASSKGLHIPGTKPEAVELPSISGSAAVGLTLTCNRGIWNGKPPPSFAFQWLQDGVPLAGATASSYVVAPSDAGHLLTCNVLASNAEGSLEVESSNGVAIAQRIVTTKTEIPIVSGGVTVVPSAAKILASLKRQLAGMLIGAHIKSVLKAGSYSFSFNSPTAGKFEVLWYVAAKSVHASKKAKPVIVARASTFFSRASKSKVKLTLTSKGRQALRNKKKVSLTVKALFSVPRKAAVMVSLTLVLNR